MSTSKTIHTMRTGHICEQNIKTGVIYLAHPNGKYLLKEITWRTDAKYDIP
jgi:hypothetical protein